MNQETRLLERFRDGIDVHSSERATLHRKVTGSFQNYSKVIAGRKDKPFHRELERMLDAETSGMILLPRGWGKSTKIVDFCCYSIGKQRDIRIVIATNALRLGIEWLREIENIFQFHAQYRNVFGNLIPNPRSLTWNDTEKIVLGRSPSATHTSLYAVSVGGSTLGKRADLILVDDIIEPEKGIPSLLELQKINEWFWKVLYPILEPGGSIFVFGTRFDQNDLYGQLLERNWPYLIVSALDENNESTFPERFSTEEILKRKANMGSIMFNLQYQNVIVTGKVLKEDWLKVATEIPPIEEMDIFQGVDPSLTSATTSDFFVEFTVGVKENKIYLLDMVRTRVNLSNQLEIIKEQAAKWKPRIIAIETNAAQILLKDILESTTLLPIRGIPSKSSKMNRFLPVAALFESNRVEIRGSSVSGQPVIDPMFNPFVEEWLQFPNSKHDDTLDALEKAIAVISFGPPAASGDLEISPDNYKPSVNTGAGITPRMFGRRQFQPFFARRIEQSPQEEKKEEEPVGAGGEKDV